jgi:hypothetical protein
MVGDAFFTPSDKSPGYCRMSLRDKSSIRFTGHINYTILHEEAKRRPFGNLSTQGETAFSVEFGQCHSKSRVRQRN